MRLIKVLTESESPSGLYDPPCLCVEVFVTSRLIATGGTRFPLFEQRIQAGEIAENPQVGDAAGFDAKQRRTEPVDRLAGRLVTAEGASVASGKPHLRERVVALGHAGEDFAAVLREGAPHRADIILERSLSADLYAER